VFGSRLLVYTVPLPYARITEIRFQGLSFYGLMKSWKDSQPRGSPAEKSMVITLLF
jgi:hypothetical protein